MIFKFSKQLTKPELFEYIQDSPFNVIVQWIIDSRVRKSYSASKFLKDQIDNPSNEIKAISSDILKGIGKIPFDENIVILACLRWVRENIVYQQDSHTWEVEVIWANAKDTLTRWYVRKPKGLEVIHVGLDKPLNEPSAFRAGDCDDVNSLVYLLARQCGIPAHKLYCICGSVLEGGHFWCAYKSDQYPLNWFFIDQCYWYDNTPIDNRNLFDIDNENKITEHASYGGVYIKTQKNNYQKIWFVFNENKCYVSLKPSWLK